MPIDYKNYPPNWKTKIVPAVRKRSEGKCEVCGLENHTQVWSYQLRVLSCGRYKLKTFWAKDESDFKRMEYFAINPKKVKVVLTVAHLDHDETNWDVTIDRLKDMCQYCHLNYDAKEKYRRYAENSF